MLPCEIKGEFKDLILNSIIFRQTMLNYEKEESVTIYIGEEMESVIVTTKEESKGFCALTKVDV